MAVYKSNKKTKDGRCWYYRVRKKDIYGNIKEITSKMYSTKQEALEEERLFMLKRDNLNHKEFILVANDYFEETSKYKKQSTIYTYIKDFNKHIRPFFENMYIDTINIQIINEWCLEMENKGLSISFLNKIYNILNSIFKCAMVNYGLTSNPVELKGTFKKKQSDIIKDEDKVKYISLEDFEKFISVIDKESVYYTLFNFLYYTGCRIGEALAITFEDIDTKNMLVKINKTLYENIKGSFTITSTKTNQNRTIKINKKLNDILIDYINKMKQYIDYEDKWFLFGGSIHMSTTTINRYKDKYIKESGCPYFSCHWLRHSHVSLLIQEYIKNANKNGYKIDSYAFFVKMSSRMGHTIPVMQRTYLHMFPTMQDEIVDLLDNL